MASIEEAIKKETLDKIKNLLTEDGLFHLYPAAAGQYHLGGPVLPKMQEVIREFIDGLLLIKRVNRHIMSLLATLCFKLDNEFNGVIKVQPKDFDKLLQEFSYFKRLSLNRAEFVASYSWVIANNDHPEIHYNTAKLEQDGINKPEFHIAAWLLHEITHILEHWRHFNGKDVTDLKDLNEGRSLEEHAWVGAEELLKLLKDNSYVQDFNDPDENKNTALFNEVKDIFEVYKKEDMDRARDRAINHGRIFGI